MSAIQAAMPAWNSARKAEVYGMSFVAAVEPLVGTKDDGRPGTRRFGVPAAIRSISGKLGMSAETLRLWVRRAETDEGVRPGLTTDERARLKELERENRELRRANEILKSAAAFFGAEFDRRQKR